MRGWRRILAALAMPLMVVLASPAPANEDDEGFLTRTLQGFLSDAGREVRIRGFEGALSSRATMRELTIADDQGVWLVLRDVVLDWDRAALFRRRVEVNELGAARIELLRLPASEAAGPALPSATARPAFALPELPVAIRIGRVRAGTVALGAPVLGEAAELTLDGSVRLEGGEGRAQFEARRTDGAEGRFVLQGSFDNASRRLVLDLDLSEGPAGIAAKALRIPDHPALALTVRGDDPIEAFRADVRLATDGRDRVTGAVTFIDTTPDSDLTAGALFRLDLGGDLRPLLARDLHPFFGPDSRLTAEGSRDEDGAIALRELRATTRALTLAGRADLGPDGLPRLIDLRLDLAEPGGGPVVLPGTSGEGRLRRAALAVAFDAARGPDWNVLGRIDDFGLPGLDVAAVNLDATGRIGLDGTGPVFEGRFEFGAEGLAADDPDLQQALGTEVWGVLALTAPGGGAPLDLSAFALEAGNVGLSGQGVLDGLAFEGVLELEAADLGRFSGLAGRRLGGAALVNLDGRLHPLTGALDLVARLETTDLSIDQREADALLAGRAGIGLSVRRDTEGTELRSLTVQAGTLGLSAQGTLAPGASDLAARLRLSALSALGPGWGGSAGLDLMLREDGDLRLLTLAGEIADIRLPPDRPGAVQATGYLRGRTQIDGRLTEQAGTLRIETLALTGDRLDLSASGTLSQAARALALTIRRIALAPLAPGLTGEVAGRVDLAGQGDDTRVALDLRTLGALRTGAAAVDRFLAGGATLSASARMQGDDLRLEAARLAASGLDIAASGAATAAGAVSLALDGRLDRLDRLVPGLDGAARLEARLARPAGARDIEASATLSGPADLTLAADGRIAPDFRLAMALTGGLDAALANPFIAPATVQGRIALSGRIDGPPAVESLRLAARATEGRYVIPGAGVAFGGITAEAEISGNRVGVRLDGAALRGGRVQAEGSIGLGPGLPVDLTAVASGLRVAQPRLFEGAVSGTVQLRGPIATGPTASGRVVIDEVEIRIPNSPLGRAGFVPDGLRHVGEGAASRRTREAAGIAAAGVSDDRGPRTPLFLDLVLEAPGRVFVRGRGLDAELGGTLRLGGTTVDTIPSGAFSLIRGRLDLLGNRFVLTEGSASLMGSFLPVVRLVATTESGGVATSVILEGPVDGPEIRFVSVPELPQDEVLARLLFGRALSSLTPFQAAQLGMSVATLTGRSESSLFDRTRQALGLDDLDLTTDADGTTTVRAGRYIGERVYADVGVDSAGRSQVTIQLDLSPSLSVRGRTDTTGRSSVGIFFERDY